MANGQTIPGRIVSTVLDTAWKSTKEIGKSIWDHRYAFAGGAVLGGMRAYYKEGDSELKFAAGMVAWDIVDDIAVVAGGGRLLNRAGWFGEFFKDPYIQTAMTSTMGYSVGTFGGTVIRKLTHRDEKIAARKRKRKTNPNKYVGVPQHINRHKINHTKMNGY